jgi:pimeloyl-ACP methyl ester carboxylesterase
MVITEGFVPARDSVRLFYRRIGEGDPSLVIPNGIVYQEDFAPLMAHRTVLLYDVRNRGRSEEVTDPAVLAKGIHNDVEDLEDVRRAFQLAPMNLLGHSYMGLMVALYAAKYSAQVGRLIQIGPSPPSAAKEYPPDLSGRDATFASVMAALQAFRANAGAITNPEERCQKFWTLLGPLYVFDPRDVARAKWYRCDLPNERRLWDYLSRFLFPSMQALALDARALAPIAAPVLVIHGRQDRSAPYGGALDWARLLPVSRLLTIDKAAHAPWIEAPDLVFAAIETFLTGTWPDAALDAK